MIWLEKIHAIIDRIENVVKIVGELLDRLDPPQ